MDDIPGDTNVPSTTTSTTNTTGVVVDELDTTSSLAAATLSMSLTDAEAEAESLLYTQRNSTMFPHNLTVEDCRDAIRDARGFREEVFDGTLVFSYDMLCNDSFPDPMKETDPKKSFLLKVRRECRGIIFDAATGKLLSRKFHKFFNVNELLETKADKIDLSEPYILMEKIDGSMITPLLINGAVSWGSKKGATTDLAVKVDAYVTSCYATSTATTSSEDAAATGQKHRFNEFALEWLSNGYTPLFEFSSKNQQIILYYPEDNLRLISIRNIQTGEYVPYERLKQSALDYDIPFIGIIDIKQHPSFSQITNMTQLVNVVRELKHIEGFVIKFDSGKHYKIKCDWYMGVARLHLQSKKENTLLKSEKDVWGLVLSGHIDDSIAALAGSIEDDSDSRSVEALKRIKKFSAVLLERLEVVTIGVIKALIKAKQEGVTRGKFSQFLSDYCNNDVSEDKLNHCKSDKLLPVAYKFFDEITATSTVQQHIAAVSRWLVAYCKDLNAAKLETAKAMLGQDLVQL
ncbi:hypothetical protein SAMD00019534_062280 [Acytostelium subglobosum LB1]|uniref:hypothetical protein n=1 Tax=Acytostelium subglobosum LB1 TaxID=1410327 RepID=UPI000644BED4|nr:hypothetical protein SAMD00019534_062280 [Acytostelium subglobosum LB1]GAM23053.1 hypothetical protein SAMD00019534_062280 [Acytostelium subglobosum LB1]|eukprot:XP_012754280.1 hypothetical protein SAMD00019534_062280 [Acytostelium subglobosum LB1]